MGQALIFSFLDDGGIRGIQEILKDGPWLQVMGSHY